MRSETEGGGATVGFLATALLGAVAAGLVVVTITVLIVDALRTPGPPESLTPRLYLLFGGTLAGILIAALAAWQLLEPISSTYRRGGLAVVAGFATVLLMLICIPVNQLLGRTGLALLVAVSALSALVLRRRARRLAAGT